jgi:hypothetical protein
MAFSRFAGYIVYVATAAIQQHASQMMGPHADGHE